MKKKKRSTFRKEKKAYSLLFAAYRSWLQDMLFSSFHLGNVHDLNMLPWLNASAGVCFFMSTWVSLPSPDAI